MSKIQALPVIAAKGANARVVIAMVATAVAVASAQTGKSSRALRARAPKRVILILRIRCHKKPLQQPQLPLQLLSSSLSLVLKSAA